MNVIPPTPPMYGGMNEIYPEFDYEASRAALTRRLDEFGVTELPKIDGSSIVEIGDPAASITDYAHDNGIDLICMPTHGHGAFRRALLGSVTAKVLHDARVPVWMSAHAPEPSHRAHPQPRHVLAAIDPDKGARENVEAAAAIAKETGATLDVVTAVTAGMLAPGVADAQLDELLLEGTREMLAKLLFETGVEAGLVIEAGGPAKVVRAAALSKRADLVVCGRGVHGIFGRLRDDGYAIIREAPCPVISI